MFCDDELKKLPWDYFLTDYEKDCLKKSAEEVRQDYPNVSFAQIVSDIEELQINRVENLNENDAL